MCVGLNGCGTGQDRNFSLPSLFSEPRSQCNHMSFCRKCLCISPERVSFKLSPSMEIFPDFPNISQWKYFQICSTQITLYPAHDFHHITYMFPLFSRPSVKNEKSKHGITNKTQTFFYPHLTSQLHQIISRVFLLKET